MPKLDFPTEAYEELRERPDYAELVEEARNLVRKVCKRQLPEEEETRLAEEGALVAISITEPGAFHYWDPIKLDARGNGWPVGYFDSEPVGDDFTVPRRDQCPHSEASK